MLPFYVTNTGWRSVLLQCLSCEEHAGLVHCAMFATTTSSCLFATRMLKKKLHAEEDLGDTCAGKAISDISQNVGRVETLWC